MKTPKSVKKFIEAIKPLKDKLYMVALFGSYARGDYDKDSDIDILVVSKSQNKKLRNKIFELIDKAMESVDYKELLSPIIMRLEHFKKIKKLNTDLYYYVHNEGRILWQVKT